MDPGIPQDALIQVSHALGIWVPRLRQQHLSSPENLRRGGASWGLRREVPEQERGEGWSWGKPRGSPRYLEGGAYVSIGWCSGGGS